MVTQSTPFANRPVKDPEPGKWVKIGDWMDADAGRGLIREAIERTKS